MSTQSISLTISPSIGTVSGIYNIPQQSNCILTIAHGAGAGMHHPFMVKLADTLAEARIASLRYNFPFMEHKKGRPDTPAVAHKTIEAALLHAQKLFPSLPLFASGKSFGGRMSSQLLSAHPRPSVKGLIFYGFPLHPAGKPSVERAEHLKDLTLPMLFLQGTRDALARMDLIESVCSDLPTATLIKIEGADHSFNAGTQNIIERLSNTTAEWINVLIER